VSGFFEDFLCFGDIWAGGRGNRLGMGMPIADKMQLLSKGGRNVSLFFFPIRAKEITSALGASGWAGREDHIYMSGSEGREKLSTRFGLGFRRLPKAPKGPKHRWLKGDGTEARNEN
jgi:hypothetical protein